MNNGKDQESQANQINADQDNIKIVLAGGGTGGHIYPALGIAKALQRIDGNIEIAFIGGHDRLEASLVPEHGFEFIPISVAGFPRRITWRWFPVVFKVCQGFLQSLNYLKKLKPDVVIGTGGYVSGPVLYAASVLGISTAIQEQNVTPGLTNRILARRADAAYLALPQDAPMFPKSIVEVTGNPIRPEITSFPRKDETFQKYQLFTTHKTIFVMGGSQGAHAVNDAMVKACPHIAQSILSGNSLTVCNEEKKEESNSSIKLQIVHQTGKSDYEIVRECYEENNIKHHVQPFYTHVEEIYSIADLMICRAGGMTVSEVTACGIPAIFIPLPAAIGNNQVQNAETVANAGAAIILKQENLTPDRLVNQIVRLLTKNEIYEQMKTNSRNMGKPYASATIANSIYELVTKGKSR